MNDDAYDVDGIAIRDGDQIGKNVKQEPKVAKSSNKAQGICIVLDDDIEKYQVEELLSAVKQFKNVLTADWIDVGFEDYCNRSRMKVELKEQIKKGLEI